MIEIDPKELIFSYLKNKRNTEKIIQRKDIKYLPDKIEFGSDFAQPFTEYVIGSLMKKLSMALGFSNFYFMENETTVTYDLTDKKLWENINFNFTTNIIDIIWYDFLEKYPKDQSNAYLKISLTEWEAVFLHTESSSYILRNYSLDHISVNCDFLAIAYLFKYFNQFDIKKHFPLIKHFEDYKNTEYPKRFLLIKKAAEYYKFSYELINKLFDHIARTHGQETFTNKSIVYYNPANPSKVFSLFNHQLFATDIVLKACNYWLNEGNLGFDDYEYINAAIKNTNLKDNITQLKNEINNLNSIRIN